ncbi:MAG: hypothetical protein E7494_13695 [Ruminococcus albus]|jgi:hypothetical protein|nr:hypothetical protein [Ruminococcus albus]
MKKIIMSLTIIAMLSLSACKEAPEEVKKENDILNSTQALDKDSYLKPSETGGKQSRNSNYEYLTLDEIRAQAEKTLNENGTNVTVEHVNISSGNVMPTYKVEPYNKNFEELSPLTEYLFGEEFTLDAPYCEYHKAGKSDTPGDPENPHDFILYMGKELDFTHSLVYHETGYAFYNAVTGTDPYRFTEFFPTEKRYRLDMGEELDGETYTMTDGSKWSVNDAVEFSVSFCDTYFAPLEGDAFTYQVTDLRVKELGEGTGFVVELKRLDKNGNSYDDHYYYPNTQISRDMDGAYSEDNWIARGCPWLYSSGIELTFNGKEKVNSFMKTNTPTAGEVLDSGETLLSLDSAIKIISASMADKAVYSFESAELEYYYVSLDCPGWDDPKSGHDESNMLSFADVELRPYWAFTMPDCYHDTQGGEDSIMVHYDSLFLVDAVTGELYVL